jgi:signal transduction histidine kinase
MPLATSDRLRFIEFLGLIAGLLIVFVSTNPIYFPFELPSESVLVLLLILFIAYSLFVYAEILSREKSSTKFIFSAAIYFTVILSLLFSGTILKAFSAETTTSSTIGAFLFITLVISYNVVILIPMQKIMKDEPSENLVPAEKTSKDEPPKSENSSGQGESKIKE